MLKLFVGFALGATLSAYMIRKYQDNRGRIGEFVRMVLY